MKQCVRCNKWFHESGSAVCNPCWVDMGQMSLEIDFEEEFDPPIDTVFDQWAERENRFP